jgi:subtilisin family serine protease
VPWQDNERWDRALEESRDTIGIGNEGQPGNEFLYRPDQLLCDAAVWTDPRDADEADIRARLEDGDATDSPEDDIRNPAAERLGLRLLSVPPDQTQRLVNEARAIRAGMVGFNHVLVANPQRYGGCAPPVPIGSRSTVPIPGAETGTTLKVAVLDTGILDDVPFSFDRASDREPPGFEDFAAGHGTMVAGVIARYSGGATILVKQVLTPPLGVADELEVADALDALPDDVDVVNASFGGPAADDIDRMIALERALDRLPPDTLVVASAGNEGQERRHYMAAFERVVGVASAGHVGEQIAVFDYSNRGDWIGLSTQGTDVETVIAPNRFGRATGTSFAAPKIASEAMKLADATTTARQAIDLLIGRPGAPQIAAGGTFVDLPAP